MPANIAGLVWVMIGCGIAVGLLLTVFRGMFERNEVMRLGTVFALASILFFLSPNAAIFFGGLTLLILVMAQRTEPMVLGLFLFATLPAASIPFFSLPGINYLLNMSVPFVVGVLLFAPAYIRRGGKPLKRMGGLDALALIALFGFILLDFRNSTFTNDLRSGLTQLFTFVVPFLAFSRVVRTREQFEKVVQALVIAMTISACIAFICQIIYWNIYTSQVINLFDARVLTKGRGSLLRVVSTYGTSYINYGTVLMAATLLAVPWASKLRGLPLKVGYIGMMTMGVFMTASRGPFVAGVAGAIILILALRNTMNRLFLGGAVLFFLGIVAGFTEQGQAIYSYLPFIGDSSAGTYRLRLAESGWPLVFDNPLFGDAFFRQRPELVPLTQGEGIIDVVNFYLNRALNYGIPLTITFTLAHVLAGFAAVRTARRVDPDDGWWRLMGGAVAGALACYTVAIATTSLLPQTIQMGFILVALNIAYVRISWAYGFAKPKGAAAYSPEPAYGA
ncbi:MAG: O-antigen ligase family protein, partial [Pseudomonadota bacterium]